MAQTHLHLPASLEPCGYLPGLEAQMEYRLMTEVSAEELEHLLAHGWRRFGVSYFRPVCFGCQECVSLRVPIEGFRPNKSQRRAWRACEGLRVETRTPIADQERFELYQAWHQMRESTRGWKRSCDSLESYQETFCLPHECARELNYYDGDRLVGVGFVDETRIALSSVYFFYDPEWADRSIGTASVLFELAWAEQRGKAHLYLGFRVERCLSTAYKSQFRPHELLVGSPALSEPAHWRIA